MPLLQSAIKEMRKDRKKTARNRVQKDKMHAAIKSVERLAKANESAKLGEAVKAAYKAIDKSAKRNLLHKKTAARRKSGVAKLAKSAAKKS
ncbi:MAG: 30S ribosomal protein S20 [Candidatus Peribacteraceae bacterium]|nr:30S ribosomal protein S20 [Candidatus Peribacteraceae bacterium]